MTFINIRKAPKRAFSVAVSYWWVLGSMRTFIITLLVINLLHCGNVYD